MPQIDYFLKIDGVDGESTDARHKAEIVVKSWNFGASNLTPVVAGSGAATGRVSLREFHIVKVADKSSPRLFTACCAGERLKSATLTCRRAGRDQQEFLMIVLTNVVVTSFDGFVGSDAALGPEEQVALAYARIEYRYHEQKPDGTLGGETVGGWDVATGKKV